MANHILIAVPPHLVQAVADLISNDGVVDSTPTSLIHDWTEKDLRQHYRESSEKMRAFMVYLAENAGSEVTSPDAADAIGYPDWNSIAGMLGAAGHRASNNFGRSDGPWNRRWDGENRAHFKMPDEVAAIVLDEARTQGDI